MKALVLSLLIVFMGVPGAVHASESSGTVDTVYGYAWSDQAGWVILNAANGNIQITDGGITGYAWNSAYGWINMAPSNGGVHIASNGTLSGTAWGQSLGWIDFSNVSISSTGRFRGTASGPIVGTLTFECAKCDVRTDYVPLDYRSETTPEDPDGSGGGSSGSGSGSGSGAGAGAGGETGIGPVGTDGSGGSATGDGYGPGNEGGYGSGMAGDGGTTTPGNGERGWPNLKNGTGTAPTLFDVGIASLIQPSKGTYWIFVWVPFVVIFLILLVIAVRRRLRLDAIERSKRIDENP